MRQLSEVKVHMEEMKGEIKKLQTVSNDRNSAATVADSPNLMLQGIFPITTLNSLQDVDDKLHNDKEFREALVRTARFYLSTGQNPEYAQSLLLVFKIVPQTMHFARVYYTAFFLSHEILPFSQALLA